MPIIAQLRDGGSPPTATTATPTPPPDAASVPPSANPETGAAEATTPENIKLWLPSELPSPYASLPAFKSIRDKERRLRLAQASDALDDIRRLRRVLLGVSQFKRLNVSGTGQRANTRIRNLYTRFQNKIDRAAARYRTARAALESLDKDGTWSVQFKVLLDADIRGPGKEDESESEGRYTPSWIWLASTAARSDDPKDPENAAEFAESMRVEWAKSKARAERWMEEEELLLEEMRRVIAWFQWRAGWWREQGCRRSQVDAALQRGLAAYAEKQAAVFEGLAQVCASYWVPYLRLCGPLPEWASPFANVAPRRRHPKYRSMPTESSEEAEIVDVDFDAEDSGAEAGEASDDDVLELDDDVDDVDV